MPWRKSGAVSSSHFEESLVCALSDVAVKSASARAGITLRRVPLRIIRTIPPEIEAHCSVDGPHIESILCWDMRRLHAVQPRPRRGAACETDAVAVRVVRRPGCAFMAHREPQSFEKTRVNSAPK